MPDPAWKQLLAWTAARGWQPAPFQRAAWRAHGAGDSGLINAPTGTGKTLAAWGGPLLEALRRPPPPRTTRALWITPLRALASDTVLQLQAPLDALLPGLEVRRRTGDLGAAERRRLQREPPFGLVSTPESLALLLSHAEQQERYSRLDSVVVDEWHELLGSKRGVLLQLCLARLRTLNPRLRVWGLSASLGNLEQARDVLCAGGTLVRARSRKRIEVTSLRPATVERYPWAGHLGLQQLPRVLARIQAAASTLLFTNTRAHAELWHQALASVWPEDEATLALHHGSLDRTQRQQVEDGLKHGRLRAVVCTSSLDLGVDFGPVEQVIQIGSPKGVARLLQRAGRCGHRPGATSRIHMVATHALELAEIAAARAALAIGAIEAREAPRLCLDVLVQHLVTMALAGGFVAAELLAEVRSAWSFRDLSDADWQACLQVVCQGGAALGRYPDYRRVVQVDGCHVVDSRRLATLHRLNIGTIASDGQVEVRFLSGGRLGFVEESFIGRIPPGESFLFAGRSLELKLIHGNTALVVRSSQRPSTVPRWSGTRLPLSAELAAQLRRMLAPGAPPTPELRLLGPLLARQAELSCQPGPRQFLIEYLRARDGWHAFFYPYAGRLVHEGLAALFARRLARSTPRSFSFAVNDYGLCLSSDRDFGFDADGLRALLARDGLVEDVRAGMNMAELAKRQFRDVARIGGLLHGGLPGRNRSARQLMLSAGLLYEVLREHEPQHLLLRQAEREVLESQLELGRLEATLARLAAEQAVLARPPRLTPFGFPLWAEGQRQQASNEDWNSIVAAAAQRLSQA